MGFRSEVIRLVKQIPEGKVTTYGTIAALAGEPRGARLVGGILSQTADDLPWQRVINKQGFISIKSFYQTKELQKSLLEQEGVEVSPDFMVDLEKYGYWSDENNLDSR